MMTIISALSAYGIALACGASEEAGLLSGVFVLLASIAMDVMGIREAAEERKK